MEERQLATILDVLDNFVGHSQRDLATAPGIDLADLGNRVREFSEAASDPDTSDDIDPLYLGGWPSANFWAVGGDLLLSSLLYAPAVLVRDPISDWFSNEQYLVRHKMSARPGYRNETGDENIRSTRAFLTHVLPQIQAWRPLIEAGVVRLVRAEANALTHQDTVLALASELEDALLGDPERYANAYAPEEIAVEDTIRGAFVFAGGERNTQLRRALADGIHHFAREYTLATTHGATYTAPFRHEQHLCRSGIGSVLSPRQRVVEALLQSRLPVFSGLTPDVISRIHDDDGFAQFRSNLHSVYQGLPVAAPDSEVAVYLNEQEQALLSPAIRSAEQSAERGVLGRLGVALTKNVFGIGTVVATGAMLHDPPIATGVGVVGTLLQARASRVRANAGSAQQVWNELVRHQRTVGEELLNVRPRPSDPPDSEKWPIAAEPSMSVTVSRGELLIDHWLSSARPPSSEAEGVAEGEVSGGYFNGDYRTCKCGSGRKYKFCCKSLTPR